MSEKFLRELYLNILAIAAGAIAVFAFAPFDCWWLLPLAYGALFFLLYLSSPAQAFLRGLLFGAAHFGLGLHWLFTVMEQYPDLRQRTAMSLIIFGIIFFLCLFPAFAGLLSSSIPKGKRNSPLWWLVLLPAVFTLSEWTRGWLFTGFPWFQTGRAMPFVISSGLLPVGGVLGVGLCFHLTTGCLMWGCLNYQKFGIMIAAPSFIVALLSASLALKNIDWTYPLTEKSLNIQLIRGNYDLDQKLSRSVVIDRVRRYQALAALEPRPALSVWPESAVSLDYGRVKDYVERGFKNLTAKGTEVFFGAYRRQADKSVNVIIQASDRKTVYTKRRLLPFGEYLPSWLAPFQHWLPKIHMGKLAQNAQSKTIINFKGIKIAPSICFEILFGEEMAQTASDSNLLLHAGDLGWFKNPWAAGYMLRTARIRALENDKPMIYNVNMGSSAFIDHQGEILKSSSVKGPPFIYQQITPRRGITWHGRHGCPPLAALCFLMGLFAFCGLNRFFNSSFREFFGNPFQTSSDRN